MRKTLPLILPALVALAALTACDPDDQGAGAPPAANYDVPPTTAGDPDGPAVDSATDVPSDTPTSPPTASERSDMTPTEAERYGSWDGTGDAPYGDDPDNDGRFSDIACDTFDVHGVTCRYGDGTVAAVDIDYRDGSWYWGTTAISHDGQCSEEDTCTIAWDHASTSPIAVGR